MPAESLPPHHRPPPDSEASARGARLTAVIRGEIETAGGAIPFARFMELALYAPGLGYYSGPQPKFGAAGDFITAPELGNLFARCLARQCAQILDQLGGGDILEAGAGSGALAAELLLELERLGQLPRRYAILELSASLRARQARTLNERAAHLSARADWLDRLPPAGVRGVVLANELLDAMPVERFRVRSGDVVQLAVGREQESFVWREQPAPDAVRERIAALALPPGYESEIGLAAEGWVGSVADVLEAGVLLIVDYGFPRAEFYHPQRGGGTLMCHYRHRAHSDPLVRVGLQDITAHVDFTAVAEAAHAAGLAVLGYSSQAQFLLGCGLAAIASAGGRGGAADWREAAEIGRLTLPQEMGELFKVLAAGRGIDFPLIGFGLQDRRGRL